MYVHFCKDGEKAQTDTKDPNDIPTELNEEIIQN